MMVDFDDLNTVNDCFDHQTRLMRLLSVRISERSIPSRDYLIGPSRNKLAEREGFEPSVRLWRTHTFQACSFDRSDTSPGNHMRWACKGSEG